MARAYRAYTTGFTTLHFHMLQQQLNPIIKSIIEEEIHSFVTEKMIGVINERVYDAYTPTLYERRRGRGGLTDPTNIEGSWLNDEVYEIMNTTQSQYSYYPRLDKIIITGYGYHWRGSRIYQEAPIKRDFIAGTISVLKDSEGELAKEFADALRKKGFEVTL